MSIQKSIHFDGTEEGAKQIAAAIPFEVSWDEYNGKPRLLIEHVDVYPGEYVKIPWSASEYGCGGV